MFKNEHYCINKIILIIYFFYLLFINYKYKYYLNKCILKYKLKNNFKSLFYNNNTNINQNFSKIIIYSALFGEYDIINPVFKQKQFDYVLFTDIIIKNKTNWTIYKIPKYINKLNMSIVKKQRFIKLHPHLFFKNYEISIYIDTNFVINGNISEFIERLLTPKFDIYIFEHPDRNCVYQECSAVIIGKKEEPDIANQIKDRYQKLNFPYNFGLSENCLIVRRHNNKKCIILMEKWWEQIKNYSKRDQLSLSYVLWKTGNKIKYISKIFGLSYFHQRNFHLK